MDGPQYGCLLLLKQWHEVCMAPKLLTFTYRRAGTYISGFIIVGLRVVDQVAPSNSSASRPPTAVVNYYRLVSRHIG